MKIPRWIKISAAVAAGITAVGFAGLYFYVKTIDFNHYADLAAAGIKGSTGRDFGIGRLDVKFFPGIELVAEDVFLGNAPWSARPQMIKIKRLEGTVAVMPLLRRRLKINRLEISESDILIEQNEKGMGNWVFGVKKPEKIASQAEASTSFELGGIDRILFEKSVLTYQRPGMKEHLQLDIQRLEMDPERSSGQSGFEFEAAFRGQPFTVKGTNGLIENIFDKDGKWPLKLDLRTEGARAEIKASLDWRSSPPLADGAVEIKIDNGAGL